MKKKITNFSLLKTNLPLFDGISPSTHTTLITTGHLQHYQPGDYIFREHDPLPCFYIVLTGTVALYKNNVQGHHRTMFVLGYGSLLNEVIFEDLPATVSCRAHEACSILLYYRDFFISLMEKDFKLTQNICNILSNRVRRLYRQLKNATSLTTIEKKLAAKLWKFGKDYGIPCEQGILIDFNITITSLAHLLGSYRETVSRALKLLIERNLIIYEAKQIIITNPEDLAMFFKSS